MQAKLLTGCLLAALTAVHALAPVGANACPDGDKKPKLSEHTEGACPDGDKKPKPPSLA
jgi:hypothetical protein